MAASPNPSANDRPRMSRRRLLRSATTAPLAVGLGLSGSKGAYAATTRERRTPAPIVRTARPHPGLTAAFEAYGDSGDGWSGADSTYSVSLPDGRRIWLFSDTFVGPVNPDGSRPKDTPFVNNTFLVQQGMVFSTVHGGSAKKPTAVLEHPDEDQWYWLGAGTVDTATNGLQVMFLRMARTGSGMWDFAWRENVLARIDPDTLHPVSTHPMPSSAGVQWASWMLRHGRHTYVYGVEERNEQKHLHVARVPGTDLRQSWEFFDGTHWSPHEQDSTRVLTGVSNEYSVTPWNGGFLLVTQDATTAFGNRILGYVADAPTGPFRSETLLYETPETGADGAYGDPDVFTYNPHEHPELRRGNRLVISYNVNSNEFDDVLDDVTKYRPRFLEITLA